MLKNKILLATVASLSLVVGGCASTQTTESTGQYVDNSAITAKVKAKLLSDKKVKSFPITVNTYKGDVQLSGFVDNRYQEARAVHIAESVEGVRSVKDDLVIKSAR